MNQIKALFFDVGGTVFDWKNTAREAIRQLADERGPTIDDEAFANDWRQEMFRVHTEVRQGNLPWINSDAMHLEALENMAESYPLLDALDHAARRAFDGPQTSAETFSPLAASLPGAHNALSTIFAGCKRYYIYLATCFLCFLALMQPMAQLKSRISRMSSARLIASTPSVSG